MFICGRMFNVFSEKKMFQSQGDPLRTGSLELLHVPVEGKRSTGQILTLWREIPGFRPALSYRISSAFLHIISVIGFKKPLHHLPSNAYQTFHNRLQP